MTTKLWFQAAHASAYQCGGFAWVRDIGGELSGGAGGEKGVSFERLELLGLLSVFPGLPAGPLLIHTANARLAVLNGQPEPEADIDLWARLQTAIAGRPVRVAVGQGGPGTAQGFVAAWADLGRDKAKAGPFRAPIPKSNLLRAAAAFA